VSRNAKKQNTLKERREKVVAAGGRIGGKVTGK